ncbi:MAG: ATP-binding protein [Planctomycetota bacterium]|jgi:serine/threonine-protein kinase RsbW
MGNPQPGAVDPTGDREIVVRVPAAGWVELTAPSREAYLERIASFLDTLSGTGMSAEAREEVRIVVNETTSNAMEWGNGGDASRRVKVSYAVFDDELVFKVEDEGEGFDPSLVPDPSGSPVRVMRERLAEGKRLGGFGLYVVRKLMDRVVYSERGNVVLLSRSLSRACSSDLQEEDAPQDGTGGDPGA